MGAATLAVLLRLLTPFAGAASLSEAKDNIETVISNYAAEKSPDGYWPVKQRDGKSQRLKLKSVDMQSIQRADAEIFKAAAVFLDEGGRTRFYAEFDVDFGGADWHVARMKWIARARKDELVKAASTGDATERERQSVEAATRAATAGKRAALPPGTPTLPELSLPASGSTEPVPLDYCRTGKCLTIYLTPWCPHCKNAGANILSLRTYLKNQGVDTRVVIGSDSEAAVLEYAETFGPGTLLDPNKTFRFSGGVPHVFVSEDGGRIVRETAGFRGEPADPAELAADLGLP